MCMLNSHEVEVIMNHWGQEVPAPISLQTEVKDNLHVGQINKSIYMVYAHQKEEEK